MPGGANVLHFNAVRVRVIGVGNLKAQMQGYNAVWTKDFTNGTPAVMTTTNPREMNRLTNFTSQVGRVKIYTDAINETFQISAITVFAKPLWTDYPG